MIPLLLFKPARVAILILAGLCFGPLAMAGVLDSVSREVQKVFDQSSPAVVKVRSLGGSAPLAGTGFFIDDSGRILTSYAVVRDATNAWVEYNDEKVEAEILGRDSRTNLALLKIEREETPHLRFGDSDSLRTASGLIGVAYPFNLPLAPSFGLVSGFDVQYRNVFFPTTHIRANLSVSPGQIGGPVLNSQGEVMGVMVLSVEDGKSCYAMPSHSVQKVVQDFQDFGEVRHSWAGVGVVEGYPDVSGRKPIIISLLYDETPAADSGLQQGDRLLKINGQPIRKPTDLMDISFFAGVGEELEVTVERGGETAVYALATTQRPAGSATVRNRMLEPELRSTDDEGGLALPVNAEQ